MRPITIALSTTLLAVATLPAQEKEWSLGASVGLIGPLGGVSGSSASNGGLFVEARRPNRRLGVRMELVAGQERLFDRLGFTCATCGSLWEWRERAALVSVAWEFRQQRTIRPYLLLGAGIAESKGSLQHFSCIGSLACGTASAQDGSSWTSITGVTSLGAGMVFAFGRVSPFVETRVGAPSASLSLGFRARPF